MLLELPEWLQKRIEPEPNSGCWLWTGNLDRGYGVFQIGGRKGKATRIHRLLFELEHGQMPDTLHHRCRTKSCINPAHLEAVSRGENVKLHWRERTHCDAGHLLSPDNVILIRRSKICKTCRNEWWAKYRKSKKEKSCLRVDQHP